MKPFPTYRLIEIDEDGSVWEILDEFAETTLMELERSEMHEVTIGLLPFNFNSPDIGWH